VVVLIVTAKVFENSTFLHAKILEESRTRRNIPNIGEALYEKPVTKIVLNVKKLKAFPLK
jgi:hypothetical protein